MKPYAFIFLMFVLSGNLFGIYASIEEAQSLIEAKQYSAALTQLNALRKDKNISDSLQAEVFYNLALFHEMWAGDYRRAKQFNQNIINLSENINPLTRQMALEKINQLNLLERTNQQENAFLMKWGNTALVPHQKDELKSSIKSGFDFLESHPEYYRLAEVYYFLGKKYITLQKYSNACTVLQKALELRPAINYYLPVTIYLKQAGKCRNRSYVRNSAWGVLGGLFLITICMFYLSQPWKWLRLRHLLPGICLILLWWVCFKVTVHFIGSTYTISKETIEAAHLETPVFAGAAIDSPGSERIPPLFQYGLIGVVGILLFSMGMTTIKRRPVTVVITAMYGFLLFSSISAIYYLRYCDQKSIYYHKGESLISYIKGQSVFQLKDPETYVFSNPKRFINPNLDNVSDEQFLNWMLKHCPIDSSLIVEFQSEE